MDARFLRRALVLGGLFAAALAVRLWFLEGRWINPDEGAHLMNGFLVLEGYVPGVDFHARQPLYGYFLGSFMKVVGVDYQAARLYPVLVTLGIGGLVYLIAARLFQRRIAVLAAAIYLFIPFTVVYGTHVKTEPLTVLLSSAGVYAMLVAADRRGHLLPAALGGAAFALAYYTRQSALAMLVVGLAVLVLALRHRSPVLRGTAGMAGGFVLVCGAVLGVYSTMLPGREVLSGSLNPAAFVVETMRPLASVVGAPEGTGAAPDALEDASGADRGEGAGGGERGSERADQEWSVTLDNIVRAVNLNSVLLVALLLSPLPLAMNVLHALRGSGRRESRAALVLWAWVAAVALAYAFYAVVRGFFPAYFGELLPPLAILAAVTAVHVVERLRNGSDATGRDLGLFVSLAVGVVLLHSLLGPEAIHRPLYFILGPVVVAVAYLANPGRGRVAATLGILAAVGFLTIRVAGALGGLSTILLYGGVLCVVFGALLAAFRLDPRRDPGRVAGFVGYSLLLATTFLWLGTSQARLDRTFDGVWSPEAVEEVAQHLRDRTSPEDRVISGAVIWELQAHRLPFLRISHPLAFRPGMDPGERGRLEEALERAPPAVVVLDGYTEQTYLPNLPDFLRMLDEGYRLAHVVDGAHHPVRVFHRSAD